MDQQCWVVAGSKQTEQSCSWQEFRKCLRHLTHVGGIHHQNQIRVAQQLRVSET